MRCDAMRDAAAHALALQAMEAMDAAIVALFDPHGYLQRNLSLLQSSPNAVDILVKHPTTVRVCAMVVHAA